MLDAYIIEKIKQEELERQNQLNEGRRIWLELPQPWQNEEKPVEEERGGPIVIPLHPDDVEDAA